MANRVVSSIARLRKLLLLALVVCVVGVTALFIFGRTGKQTAVRTSFDDEASQAGEGTTLIGQDFDYTFTDREKPIFRIRGASIRAARDETIFLDDVGVTLYDEQGRPFHVESRQAAFNRVKNEGHLQGNVVLKGPENLEIRTSRLQLRDQGATLYAPRAVEIRYGGRYVARGARARVFMPEDLYVMAGNVSVDSVPGVTPPVALRAQRLVYEREKRLVRVEGKARLSHGTDFLNALRLNAFLTPDETGLVFVRGLWEVEGRVTTKAEGGAPATVNFSGKDIAVLMRPEANQVRRVDLEGSPRQPARLESTSGGLTRVLQGLRVEGVLGASGALDSAEAFGGVVIRESGSQPGSPAVRQARGQRAQAGFRSDGQLATVSLMQNVSYQDGKVSADGERAEVNFDSGQGEFFGSPVQVRSERGQVSGPRVVYQRDQQTVQVLGGVRALLEQAEDQDLAGSPLGQGEGPVRVEAREALWRQSPSSFVFRGDVRAWRGDNLLLAPELRGDNEKKTLTATGGVKSLWIPKPGQVQKAAGTGQAAKRSPVEVTANEMNYVEPQRGGQGVLTYTGSVRVEQEGKTLACEKLDVEMGADNQADTLLCNGDAKLNDPATGRNIEGQRAVYELDTRQVEMFGEPWVTMKDREGHQVQGRRLVYSIEDGKVQVKGTQPAAPGSTQPAAPAPNSGGTEGSSR